MHASKEDADKLNMPQACKARFHSEPFDPTKGSDANYIAKYISKNIDGSAMEGEKDDEID